MVLRIQSHGPLILASNFWEGPAAAAGLCYLSLNAGAFRLLLPASQEGFLGDMRAAKGCAISRAPWPAGRAADALEVLFDDDTPGPFALHLPVHPDNLDRLPLPVDVATEWVLSVWTQPRRGRPHKALERPCRYRLSPSLPDLRPWGEP